ncbi:MAG: ABC transporter ATP-binding protein [Verrucomicrobiota bacterium]|jgi:ABC-2 type transport system ATP-binding protein|nr:ABC transporter ATP-binding protein [Verrucomicrobiota bacterium]
MTSPPPSRSQTTDAAIRARDLVKTFRDFWRRPKVEAVHSISFDVPPGQVFGLLGPNGSGKSTTIKMILGLLFPTSGTLEVLGASPQDTGVKRRIGYLPEESYLYPQLTPLETLSFYARLFNLPAEEAKERIHQLLEMIGLSHARHRPVGEFSKGMARRIGLAQALLNDPDLIILDEPTSGLDPQGTHQVKNLILALAARGKTVLLTSHLLADVEEVCNEVAILFNGRILAQGTLDSLLTQKQKTTLSFPTPRQPDTLRELMKAAKGILGTVPALTHPRQALEPYFLEVIRKAEGDFATSGAAQDAPLAPFLEQRGG